MSEGSGTTWRRWLSLTGCGNVKVSPVLLQNAGVSRICKLLSKVGECARGEKGLKMRIKRAEAREKCRSEGVCGERAKVGKSGAGAKIGRGRCWEKSLKKCKVNLTLKKILSKILPITCNPIYNVADFSQSTPSGGRRKKHVDNPSFICYNAPITQKIRRGRANPCRRYGECSRLHWMISSECSSCDG